MAKANDVRSRDHLLSFELLSAVHSECHMSVDTMEHCLLLEQEPNPRELQLKRQCDDLMAKNADLEQRLMISNTALATLQTKQDTLRHNFTSLHRIAISKLRQRDMEIEFLRKNSVSKNSNTSVASLMDSLKSFGPLTATELAKLNSQITDLCPSVSIKSVMPPYERLSGQLWQSRLSCAMANTGAVNDDRLAPFGNYLQIDSNVSTVVTPELFAAMPVDEASHSISSYSSEQQSSVAAAGPINGDSSVLCPTFLISSDVLATPISMADTESRNTAPFKSNCQSLSSSYDNIKSVDLESFSFSVTPVQVHSLVDSERCYGEERQFTDANEKDSEKVQISLEDQYKKSESQVLKSSVVDHGNELVTTSTKSGFERRNSFRVCQLEGRKDALAEKSLSSVKKNGESLSTEPLNNDAHISEFSTKSKVSHGTKSSTNFDDKVSFLQNSSPVARCGNDGYVEVRMSAQGKNVISTPASVCSKVESTSKVKSSLANKPETSKSFVRSVDLAPPTFETVSRQNSVDKKASATPEPAVTDYIKSDEKRTGKDSSIATDAPQSKKGQTGSVSPDKHDDSAPANKKRKRSSEAHDSTKSGEVPQIKRVKPPEKTKTDPGISQVSAKYSKLTDQERILLYKTAGDQREIDSRRSLAEMEHLHRKLQSTRSSSRILSSNEPDIGGVTELVDIKSSTSCEEANQIDRETRNQSKTSGALGMPSSLSVFTLRSMQKAEKDKLELDEQKKQQIVEKESEEKNCVSSTLHISVLTPASGTSHGNKSGVSKTVSVQNSDAKSSKQTNQSAADICKATVAKSNDELQNTFSEVKFSGMNVHEAVTEVPCAILKMSASNKMTAAKLDASNRLLPNLSDSVIKLEKNLREESSLFTPHLEKSDLRDRTLAHMTEKKVALSGSLVSSSVEAGVNISVSTAKHTTQTFHDESAKMVTVESSSKQTNLSGSHVANSVKPSRSYSSSIRIVKKSVTNRNSQNMSSVNVPFTEISGKICKQSDQTPNAAFKDNGADSSSDRVSHMLNSDIPSLKYSQSTSGEKDLRASEVEATWKVASQGKTSSLAPSTNQTSQVDVLRRLQDMLSVSAQNVSSGAIMSSGRLDPRLKAKLERESEIPAERPVSSLDILSALTNGCLTSKAVKTPVEVETMLLPSSQSAVIEPQVSTRLSNYKVMVVDDTKPQASLIVHGIASCNLYDSNSERHSVNTFRGDPRIESRRSDSLKTSHEDTLQPQKSNADSVDCSVGLEKFEKVLKSLKVCSWSPCKSPASPKKDAPMKNTSSVNSTSCDNTAADDSANETASVPFEDLLDFALTGGPDEPDGARVDSMASLVDDADSCGFGVDETLCPDASSGKLCVAEDSTENGMMASMGSHFLQSSVVSLFGDCSDAMETDAHVTSNNPTSMEADSSCACKSDNDRSCCSSCCSFKHCELTPPLATESERDTGPTLTTDSHDNVDDPHKDDASNDVERHLESFQFVSDVEKSNSHEPITKSSRKVEFWDIEPSSSDDEDRSCLDQCRPQFDAGRSGSLAEQVGSAVDDCNTSDDVGERVSDSEEEVKNAQAGENFSSVRRMDESVTNCQPDQCCQSEESATPECPTGQYFEECEPVCLLIEGDNTMNRLFGEISDSDGETSDDAPQKTANLAKIYFEDGEIDESAKDSRNGSNERKDYKKGKVEQKNGKKAKSDFMDGEKEKINERDCKKEKISERDDETHSFKRQTSNGESVSVASSSSSNRSYSKHTHQSSLTSRRKSARDEDFRRNSRSMKNEDDRHSDVRRDRDCSKVEDLRHSHRDRSEVDDRRSRRIRESPRKPKSISTSRRRSPVVRSPLRTRTAENSHHGTSNIGSRSEPLDHDRNYGLSVRSKHSPARRRIAKK